MSLCHTHKKRQGSARGDCPLPAAHQAKVHPLCELLSHYVGITVGLALCIHGHQAWAPDSTLLVS